MNRLLTLTAATFISLATTLAATGASAYEINGSSDTQFVLKCKDGTTNTSSMPPNHITATAFCADHGGIAAGYPKQVVTAQKTNRLAPAVTNTGSSNTSGGLKATDYNSSRSNKSSN